MNLLFKNHFVLYFVFLLIINIGGYSQSIVINEFMSSNVTTIIDLDGDYSDWIELYNNTDTPVNLENYTISDDSDELEKWIFPSIDIPAYGFLLLFASGKDIYDITELHTNFKIKQSGENLILSNPDGEIICAIEPVSVPTDQTFGCIPDGDENMLILNTPSPNASNINNNEVVFSHPSGFYSEAFSLSLVSTSSNHEIHYTVNGGVPTINSPVYTAPILIANNTNTPNNFSNIPTTPLEGPWQLDAYVWQQPETVYKANVIRFASFLNGYIQSDIYTKTYFVDPDIQNRYTFPILSLVTDSLNLFQYDTGIYIPGLTYELEGFTWLPNGNYHNRGREWERKIHVSYFENDGTIGFETDAGMRMRGYASVVYPQKTFGIYFRSDYGDSKIDFPIFHENNADKYKRLVFRNSGQDFLLTHFRDAVLQDLISSFDLELQNFQPSVVFFNGEYWGIHGLRQKYDKHYFHYHFDIDEDEIDIVGPWGAVEEGSNDEYFELLDYIESHDMSINEYYQYVTQKVDIPNFIDFQIAEIYYANYDWPCNNYKIWKSNEEGSKWRFLIYDLDFSFGYKWNSSYQFNSLLHATSEDDEWPHCPISNLIFRKLLENDDFEIQFIAQFAYHLNHAFDYNVVIDRINEFKTLFIPEIEEHSNRWAYPSLDVWDEEIDDMVYFARRRPCAMRQHILNFFNLSESEFDFECIPVKIGETYPNSGIAIYPNPSTGIINIESRREFSGLYQIRSIDGLLIQKGKMNDNFQKIDLTHLLNGVYIIRIDDEKKQLNAKIIISH